MLGKQTPSTTVVPCHGSFLHLAIPTVSLWQIVSVTCLWQQHFTHFPLPDDPCRILFLSSEDLRQPPRGWGKGKKGKRKNKRAAPRNIECRYLDAKVWNQHHCLLYTKGWGLCLLCWRTVFKRHSVSKCILTTYTKRCMTAVPEEILFSVGLCCTYTRHFCNHTIFSVHPNELYFKQSVDVRHKKTGKHYFSVSAHIKSTCFLLEQIHPGLWFSMLPMPEEHLRLIHFWASVFFSRFIERLGQRCAYLCLGNGGKFPNRHGQCGDISFQHEPPLTPCAINWTSLTTCGQFQTVSLRAGRSWLTRSR